MHLLLFALLFLAFFLFNFLIKKLKKRVYNEKTNLAIARRKKHGKSPSILSYVQRKHISPSSTFKYDVYRFVLCIFF